jgi:hypothetical protein
MDLVEQIHPTLRVTHLHKVAQPLICYFGPNLLGFIPYFLEEMGIHNQLVIELLFIVNNNG